MKRQSIGAVMLIIGICLASTWNPEAAIKDSYSPSDVLPQAAATAISSEAVALTPIMPLVSTESGFPLGTASSVWLANGTSIPGFENGRGVSLQKDLETYGPSTPMHSTDSRAGELVPSISVATRSFTILAGASLLLPFALSMFRIAAKAMSAG